MSTGVNTIPPSPTTSSGIREFLWNAHSYQNEYIRFSDAKAAVVMGWCSAFLGFMVDAKVHHSFTDIKWQTISGNDVALAVLTLLSYLSLTLGFAIAVLSVIPRLGIGKSSAVDFPTRRLRSGGQHGFIYWGEVCQFSDANAFSQDVTKLSDEQLTDAVAKHLHVISGIAERKFRLVVRSVQSAAFGSVCAAIYVITST